MITYCPSDFRIEAPSDQFKTQVYWGDPTATDDLQEPLTVLRSHRSGDTYFYVGRTDVSYWFIDRSFNVAQCTFTVKVESTSKCRAYT